MSRLTFICCFREGAAALTAPCTSLCFIWSRAAPLVDSPDPANYCRQVQAAELESCEPWEEPQSPTEPRLLLNAPSHGARPNLSQVIPPKTQSGPALGSSLPRSVHTSPSCRLHLWGASLPLLVSLQDLMVFPRQFTQPN